MPGLAERKTRGFTVFHLVRSKRLKLPVRPCFGLVWCTTAFGACAGPPSLAPFDIYIYIIIYMIIYIYIYEKYIKNIDIGIKI